MAIWVNIVIVVVVSFVFLYVAMMKKEKEKVLLIPPGPPKLPLIGNFHQLGSSPHVSLWNLSKKYGPVMHLRLGSRPTLVVSSAAAAREILKTHDLHACSRPSLAGARRLFYNHLDIALSPYGNYWRDARKLVVESLLSSKRVESFASAREQVVRNMVASIIPSSGFEVNLGDEIFHLAVSLVSKVAFGESFRVTEADRRLIHDVKHAVLNLCASDCFPRVGWVVDRLTGFHAKLKRVFRDSDAFCLRVIDHHHNHKRKKDQEEDIVGVLLRDPNFTQDHIKSIIMDILLGGSDNNATTITWAMTELSRNARVMKKAQDEIRAHVGDRGRVSESDVQHFPYLKMIVKETLRLHVPEVLLIPRETTSHFKIGGYNVFPKTLVLVNAWGIARDGNVWHEPEEFYPERFEDNPVDYKGQHFEFLPFGAGRRICPGMSFGVAVVELALANLLHSFDWKLPVGVNPGSNLPLKLVPVTYNCHKPF